MPDNFLLRNTFRLSGLWLIGLIGFLSSPFSRAFTISWDPSPEPASSVQVLSNGSFESDFDGWTGSGNRVVRWAAPDTAPDGGKLVSFSGSLDSGSPANGVLSQTFATIPGTTYTLAFHMGVTGAKPGEQKLEVTVAGAGNLLSQIVSKTNAGGGTAQWGAQTYTFVANSTTTTLTFRDVSTVTEGIYTLLDYVRVTGANSSVLGYRVHYGTSSGNYTSTLDVGMATSARITDPPAGVTYYAVVTAYAAASIESLPSQEVSYTGKAVEPAQDGTVNSDFNGDGSNDILWRDVNIGTVAVWFMGPNGWTGQTANLGAVSTEWEIAGRGDFDRDGKCDILWRNAATGNVAISLLDGTTWKGSWIQIATVSTAWEVVGTGDFNRDGNIDILWRAKGGGEIAIWTMNGTAWTGISSFVGVISPDWRIVATGDFAGEGNIDILWRGGSGELAIWLMSGTTWTGGAVGLGVIPLEWQIAGTGDFNHDGKTDLLWQSVNGGDRAVWFMNGVAWDGASASLGVVPTSWQIAN